MENLHKNQKKILTYLLEHKEGATLGELASHLEITKTAVKEHLLKVEHLGYITYSDAKGQVGRPRRRYLISPEGYDAFPKQYSWLSNVLLEHLAETSGPEFVSDTLDDLAEKMVRSMESKFNSAKNSADLLMRVVETLNALGYRSSLRQSDSRKTAVIEATNCVYHAVAQKHPVLCRFDVKFIEKALGGMDVKLESCIARGGSVCRFCIKKK